LELELEFNCAEARIMGTTIMVRGDRKRRASSKFSSKSC